MESNVLHRRLAALAAGVAVAGAVVASTFLVLPAQSAHDENVDYGYVYSGAKSSSVDFVRANLTDDSLVVLGSSEFSTPSSTVPQVPAQVFGTHDYGVHLMLVGEAFDQCLWHTMALGALANEGLPRDKVVLIVGLGQYTDGGLDNSSFGARFSYSLYEGFCANERIPEEARAYVMRRLAEQGVDETTIRAGAAADPVAAIDRAVLDGMQDLRLRYDLIGARAQGIARAQGPVVQPEWDTLRAEALADAQKMSTTNDWGAEDNFYTTQLGPALDGLAGARAAETYTDTTEYDDLDCFLDVCDACGVQPLVIIEPVMGPYYDHIGITQQTREAAYQRIRDVVAAHPSARLTDYSDREYEKYFLFDIVHFGWTGWIEAQRSIYEFATEVS